MCGPSKEKACGDACNPPRAVQDAKQNRGRDHRGRGPIPERNFIDIGGLEASEEIAAECQLFDDRDCDYRADQSDGKPAPPHDGVKLRRGRPSGTNRAGEESLEPYPDGEGGNARDSCRGAR